MSIRKSVSLPSLGRVSVNFNGPAERVDQMFEIVGEYQREKDIKQLGLIANVIEGASHSRYEYLMMQCSLCDILDNLHKGASAAQGSIKIGKDDVLGNSLLKSWFMLSNFGHAKNTYGDEKSLHLFMKKRKGMKTALLKRIKRPKLRNWCLRTIDNFYYHRLHYVIAAWRIYKEAPGRIALQDELAKYLELLLLPLDEIEDVPNLPKLLYLRQLFEKVRDLSIVSLDGHYSHVPVSVDLVSALVSFDEIEGGVSGQRISSVLKPVREYLCKEVYLDKNVLALQRAYEVTALKKMFSQYGAGVSYDTFISEAIHEGLISGPSLHLKPFHRILINKEMQPESSFYDEFRSIVIRSRYGCINSRAYLDVNPFNKVRYADFFIDEKFPTSQLPSLVHNICTLIDRQLQYLVDNHLRSYRSVFSSLKDVSIQHELDQEVIEQYIDESRRLALRDVVVPVYEMVFPAFHSLLWSCVSYFLKDSYRFEAVQRSNKYQMYGICIPGANRGLIIEPVQEAMRIEGENGNVDRVHELVMLHNAVKRNVDGYQVACLARVNLCDLSAAPSKRLITDFDGLLLTVTRKELKIEVFEAKNTKSVSGRVGKARKDLKEKLVPALSPKTSKGYRISPVSGFGAKLVIKASR